MKDINSDILVSICCITYNQAPSIRQCLDGFLMQKTNFKFEIIVHDDCSTDGTTEIVKEYSEKYPDLFVPIFQIVNQYQNGNKRILVSFVYPKVKGKYIALCEGDDYWTSPDKLQIQVDFLESHKDYSMCFHKVEILTENSQRLGVKLYNDLQEKDYSGNEIISRWIVPTCSVVFCSDIYKYLPHDNDFCVGDNVLFLTAASRGRCFCMNRTMGVYRRSISGWIANNTGTVDSEYKMIKHMNALLKYFPQYKRGINSAIALRYFRITIYQFKCNDLSFIITLLLGLWHYHFYYLKHLFGWLKKKIIARLVK